MKRFGAPIAFLAGGLGALSACGLFPDDDSRWYDSLSPDSPCYRVNLLDGLNEDSGDEVYDLFDCLNYHDHLRAFEPTKAALGVGSRSLDPGAVELARVVNAVEMNVGTLIDSGLTLIDSPDLPIDTLLDITLELMYGTPAQEVRSTSFNVDSPAELENGIVEPLSSTVPMVATTLLDEGSATLPWAADVLRHDRTTDWVRFMDEAIRDEHFDDWPRQLGLFIQSTQDSSNDHWHDASGDSLRDVVRLLSDEDQAVFDAIEPELTRILSDSRARTRLPYVLDELYRAGHLEPLPEQLRWMVSVNASGEPLARAEDSALLAFVRLLASTNRPMTCSLDLWVTSLDVDLGNLAIAFLELLAEADPDVAQSSFGLLGEVLGWGFSEWALEEIADSGVCPALTPQVMDDLKAVDVLYEPEAYHLLASFIALMNWLEDGNNNQLYAFADVMTDAYDRDVIPPTEELIRDIGQETLVAEIVDFLPVLIAPKSHGLTETTIEFDALVELALAALDQDEGLAVVQPIITEILDDDSTWTALSRTAVLLAEDEVAMHRVLDVLSNLLAQDPELDVLNTVSDALDDDRFIQPMLRLLEIRDLSTSLLRSTSSADGRQAPRAFVATLIVDGTLDELLNIFDWLLQEAGSLTPSQDEAFNEDRTN